jgi:enamine deaminase RidA (YjgF/YER057c/UK114 family)
MTRQNISSGRPFEEVYGYSRAVRAGGQVHVSGTTAQGEDTYTQAKAIFEIIGKALQEAGSTFEDVVRTVTYVTDIKDSGQVAKAHHEVLGHVRPAATLVQVTALVSPELKVEIEAYAVDPA